MKYYWKNKLFPACIALIFILLAYSGNAQNAAFELRISTENANPGDTIDISVTVRNFVAIEGYQFALLWNHMNLRFIHYSQAGTQLPGQQVNELDGDNGILRTLWTDENAVGVTLPDDALLFTLKFKVLATQPGFYPVKINGDQEIMTPEFSSAFSGKLPFVNIIGGAKIGSASNLSINSLGISLPPCFGNLAQFSANVSGGTPPYQYSWSGPQGFTSTESNFANTTPGTYWLTATDSGGAAVQALVSFNQLGIDVKAVIDLTQADCRMQNGCAYLSPYGGVPPFSIAWQESGSVEFSRCDLAAGNYTVTLTDSRGCTGTVTFKIEFSSPVSVTLTPTMKDCSLGIRGSIAATPFGTSPFSYQWSNGDTTATIQNLEAGEYSVTITDATGCKATRATTIIQDSSMAVVLTPTFADCRFGQKGEITTVVNGFPPHTYQWSNGSTLAHPVNLDIGDYAVTVQDGNGCIGQSKTTIKDYGTFDWFYYPQVENSNTPNLNNFVFKGYAVPQRANPPLLLEWNSGTVQEISDFNPSIVEHDLTHFSQLPNGTNQVTITDDDGCVFNTDFLSRLDPAGQMPSFQEPIFYILSDINSPQIKVMGKRLAGIKKIRFYIAWDNTEMQFDSVSLIASTLPGVINSNFTNDFYNARLLFSWESPNPEGYSDNGAVELFKVAFKNGHTDYPQVNFFGAFSNQITVIHATDGKKAFMGRNGVVAFTTIWDNPNIFADFQVIPPTCANDGHPSVQLSAVNYDSNLRLYDNFKILTDEHKLQPRQLLLANFNYLEFTSSVSGRYTVSIPPYSAPYEECVWPGDADNNNVVNHFDLLYLGLGLGQTGLPRAETDTLWHGVDALGWPQQTPKRHVNFKNLDLDGNGIIEIADTAILYRHWEQMINHFDGSIAYSLPAQSDTSILNNAIQFMVDTVRTGIPIAVPVSFEANGIQGLAFCISYDPNVMIGDMKFEPESSWLGDPTANLIQVQKDFPGQSRIDIALTRTDGQAASGNGIIGHLLFTLKELPADSIRSSLLFASHTLGITPAEHLIEYGKSRKNLMTRGARASATHEGWLSDNAVQLSPNPASEILNIKCLQETIQEVVVANANGSIQQHFKWGIPTQNAQIDIEKLPAGAYFARIYTAHGIVVKKFVVAR